MISVILFSETDKGGAERLPLPSVAGVCSIPILPCSLLRSPAVFFIR